MPRKYARVSIATIQKPNKATHPLTRPWVWKEPLLPGWPGWWVWPELNTRAFRPPNSIWKKSVGSKFRLVKFNDWWKRWARRPSTPDPRFVLEERLLGKARSARPTDQRFQKLSPPAPIFSKHPEGRELHPSTPAPGPMDLARIGSIPTRKTDLPSRDPRCLSSRGVPKIPKYHDP